MITVVGSPSMPLSDEARKDDGSLRRSFLAGKSDSTISIQYYTTILASFGPPLAECLNSPGPGLKDEDVLCLRRVASAAAG
jgi:hypothetical protein